MTPEEQKTIVDNMVEITLPQPDNFLKVKETLTRIGIASAGKKELYQSAHILHKRNPESGASRYFIVHFKELFMLDGKATDFTEDDVARRNTIANLLDEWGLISVIDKAKIKEPRCPISNIKVLPYKDKDQWRMIPKYTIGTKRKAS